VCRNVVQISGAVGTNAGAINGFYEPTDEFVGNASVYKKLGDVVEWIEYYAPFDRWMLRSTAARGPDTRYACALISPPRALEDCPIGCWKVSDGSSFVNQASFSVAVSSKASFEAAQAAQVVIYSRLIDTCIC